MSLPTQLLLIEQFIAALRRIRDAVARLLTQLFTAPGSWRDEDLVRFVSRAVPLVEGAQRAAASLTEDYLTRMLADQAGEPYRPQGIDLARVTGSAVRNGVDMAEVYARPFSEVWASLAEDDRRSDAGRDRDAGPRVRRRDGSRGVQVVSRRDRQEPNAKPLTAAVRKGERRAELLGLTDVELAVTHTVQERLADEPRVRFYRRVLTGDENCGMCVVASTQRYRTKNLMPIHPRCDCVVAPIFGGDPGRVVNTKRVAPGVSPTGETRSGVPVFADDQLVDLGGLLDDVHEAIADEFGDLAVDARRIDYRKVITVEQHGEMGPLLTVSRHKFTKRQVRDRDLAARRR